MAGALDLSIIICTRNRSARLEGTLKSLTGLRTQRNWEVLMVDNASSDATADTIKQADDCGGRLRYLRVERIGLGAARDAAWRQASGRIIAFTDDDCYLELDFVDAVVGVFDSHPEVGCVGGKILLYDPQDAPETIDMRDTPVEIATPQCLDSGTLHGANLSFRRSILEHIGGFDPCLGAGTPFPCEDIDAVAATLWSGERIRFDPAPKVWHHHRRRANDIHKLRAGYDRGRGAYFAKYLLRSESRVAYLRGWLDLSCRHRDYHGLARLGREISAASAYLLHRRAFAFLIAGAPIAAAAYCGVAVLVGLRMLKARFYSRPVPHW